MNGRQPPPPFGPRFPGRFAPRFPPVQVPNIPVGEGPIPGVIPQPTQDPNQPEDGATRYSSSGSLVNGQPVKLLNLSYKIPTAVTAYLETLPLAGQGANVQGEGAIVDSTLQNELWVLGEAQLGIGGSLAQFNFDMPLGQICQFACVCESLQIQARLYQPQTPSNVHPVFTTDFINPPTFTGTPVNPVAVRGLAGDGHGGISNLTRRARFQIDPTQAAKEGQCPVPVFADTYRVIGASTGAAGGAVTTTQFGTAFLAGVATAFKLGPAPIDAAERPIGNNVQAILFDIPADVANPSWFEIVFRLGLSGFPA